MVSRRAPTTFFAIGGGRLVGEIEDNSVAFGVCTNTLVSRLDDGRPGLNDFLVGGPSGPRGYSLAQSASPRPAAADDSGNQGCLARAISGLSIFAPHF